MTPLWEDFIKSGPAASLGIRLPSGEVEMSRNLLSDLRLSPIASPRTLDQWRELCHPADHRQMQYMDRSLADRRQETLSLTRRLYCGDGVYRSFRLDACIQRGEDGSPRYLMGIETPLEEGRTDGSYYPARERTAPAGQAGTRRISLMGARRARTAGQQLRLRAPDEERLRVLGLEEENLVLRRAIQRQALRDLSQPEGPCPRDTAQNSPERADTATAGGTGTENSGPAAAGRNPEDSRKGNGLTLGILGLAGSGRSDLMRVLMAEGLLPEGLTLTETPGEGDIVLYTIPLRGHLKDADANLLSAAIRRGQRVIVLLTMTDLERDEAEAGHILLPRRQRVERALQNLREELARASIPPCPIIPVSARLAWRGFYDHASRYWRESRFDELLRQLAPSPGDSVTAASPQDTGTKRSDFSAPSRPDVSNPGRAAAAVSPSGLFSALLLSLREQALRSRFLALPVIQSDVRGKKAPLPETADNPRRLVMMGLNHQEALRLVSRLAHDSSLLGEEGEARNWLFFGQGEPPFPQGEAAAVPCVRRAGVLAGFDILVAPQDVFSPGGMEWETLFARWTPVVHMDLVRVDSSLSELARSPWFSGLSSAPRWVMAFAHSGLFDTRLSGLLEAEERVMRFAILRGFQGRMNPFIYENYDPRYTDFLELGTRVRYNTTADEISALIAGWGRDELDYTPPFTRNELALALLGIRSKLQRIRQRIAR